MFKKGSLSLSINAIVVLILAVTMLGLGLLFMQNMMGGAMDQLAGVSEEVENEMIRRIESSRERLEFRTFNFEIGRSRGQTYYYGVLNDLDIDTDFNLEFHCQTATSDNANPTDVDFRFIGSTSFLRQGEIDVQSVEISAAAQAEQDVYRCAVFVDSAENPATVANGGDPLGTYRVNMGSERYEQLIRTPNLYVRKTFQVTIGTGR